MPDDQLGETIWAKGIGAACAATLAREGAKVVVTDLDNPGSQTAADKIGGAGGEAVFLHQDVSIATERRFGRLDVMVANAGSAFVQSCRNVADRLASANCGEPRRRVLVCEIRCPCDAAGRRRIHHYYVVGCRSSWISWFGGLLRDKGRRAAVREGGRDGVRRGRRPHTHQYGPSRRSRHADLDEITNEYRQ
jgi:hypothetical protein